MADRCQWRFPAHLRAFALGIVALLASHRTTAGDVVFMVDTTASMFSQPIGPGGSTRVQALRTAVIDWTAAAVVVDAQARFALVLVNGDGSCVLATAPSERAVFLAGAIASFDESFGSTVRFSSAIQDCALLATLSPRVPHDVVIVTDTIDETSTAPQRDAAIATLIGSLRAVPSVVMLAQNDPATAPALSDLIGRGSCLAPATRWFVTRSTSELVAAGIAAIGGYTEASWPCNRLFADGFEAAIPG